jgi:hypothetical protein
MTRQSNTWSLFLRYQAQAERHYRRAVEEFEKAHSAACGITKRTHFGVSTRKNETTCALAERTHFDPQSQSAPGPVSV